MNNKVFYVLLVTIVLIFEAGAIFVVSNAQDEKVPEYGSAQYQVEYLANQGASKGITADCELRANEQGARTGTETPKTGDIFIQECRVRKTGELVWKGSGEKLPK